MYALYKDIRTRIGTPHWIDDRGVPRYEPFHPSLLGIYDRWAVIFEVECQACIKRFRCASGVPDVVIIGVHPNTQVLQIKSLDHALEHLVSWGDAPWHDADGDETGFESQCSGTTMTTVIPNLVEAWHLRGTTWEWVKVDISQGLRAKHTESWEDYA